MGAFREYWIVERDDHPGADMPLKVEPGMTPRYFSECDARTAAANLARKFPLNGYVVLHAIGEVHSDTTPVVWSAPAPF